MHHQALDTILPLVVFLVDMVLHILNIFLVLILGSKPLVYQIERFLEDLGRLVFDGLLLGLYQKTFNVDQRDIDKLVNHIFCNIYRLRLFKL